MQKQILQIHIGLPDEFQHHCFWIERPYRTNNLSFLVGGTDIVIQFTDGSVYGYDWVKYPSRYVQRVLRNKTHKCSDAGDQLIHRVFARKYYKSEYSVVPFVEIWNSTSALSELWQRLEEYTIESYSSFLDYFKIQPSLSIQYLSIWYPFSYHEILKYWEVLVKGDAHYSIFISDTETTHFSKLGLSYNSQLRWNSKLRSMYEYGFWNPFTGCVEGTGGAHVEHEEQDYLDMIIPLSIDKEIEERNSCAVECWPYTNDCHSENSDGPELIDKELNNREFSSLGLNELKRLISEEKFTFLTNRSIWDNTMSKIADQDFCDAMLDEATKLKAVKY